MASATASIDINLYGSSSPDPVYSAYFNYTQPADFEDDPETMIFQVAQFTRFRNLFRHNNSFLQVVDQFRVVPWYDILTIPVPVTYRAQPALLERLLYDALSPIDLEEVVPRLLSFAFQSPWPRHIGAEVDVFADSFLSEQVFNDRILFQLMEMDLEEEERRRASDTALENLRENFGFDCDASNEGEEVGTCLVCLEDLCGKLIRLPCSHLYHETCILRWLERKNSCPMCRRQLSFD